MPVVAASIRGRPTDLRVRPVFPIESGEGSVLPLALLAMGHTAVIPADAGGNRKVDQNQ